MPVPAYNTFNEIFDSLDADDYDSAVPFKIELIKPDDFTTQSWPVQPGDYSVINATKSIALAVLQGIDMNEPELATVYSKIAIIGSITTENLGVEHLIKNLIANKYKITMLKCSKQIKTDGEAHLRLIAKKKPDLWPAQSRI